ncbi:glycosyl hydrolase [Barnesiella sp. An55]|uniref:glycoside hydrolase family 26 protein n=1 Tax=Barnesiella sp. An55 TaxID=1965646 RepID=UPI000B393E29|nr:glycosyl hydrolase [Barnesiella sp. An55]OUN73671.1 hypothetical protein B5G10_03665 [Barnesiella sp. An55]
MVNRIIQIILLLNIALLMACGSSPKMSKSAQALADPKASAETVQLYLKLQKNLNKGIMLGHQDDLAYGYNWFEEPGRSDVKSVCGDYPAVYGWDIGGIERGNSTNCDSISFEALKAYVRQADQQGGISVFTWRASNPVTGGDASDCGQHDAVKLILENDSVQKIYLASLDKVARFFASLTNEAGEPIAVIFQPFHAHNANRPLWWNESQCTSNDFKKLWVLTVNYLRDQKQTHNLLYAYSVYSGQASNDLQTYYPGNRYVDIIGISSILLQDEDYNGQKFVQGLKRDIAVVTQFAEKNKKIPAITSTGLEGVKISSFFSQYLYPTISPYQLSFVLFGENAWNEEKHYFIPVPGHPASEDFMLFASYPDILTCSDLKR